MKRLAEPARRSFALVVVALLSSCLQLLALDGATPARAATPPLVPDLHGRGGGDPQQAGYTRPRRVDEGVKAYPEAGPVIRIGLMTDAATVSLNSPSGLAVRVPTLDVRDSQKISSGRLRAEIRRPRATPQASALGANPGQTASSQMKPGRRTQPAISKPGRQTERKVSAEEDNKVPRVVAFDADRMVASSETVLIVSPAPDAGARPRGDSEVTTKEPGGNQSKRAAFLRVGDKDYRGEIHLLLNARGRINIVNVVPLEEYLRGVVPLELSPGAYPQMEALKAQAVAARTYALSHRNRFQREGFDLTSDARSQVYGGLSAEQAMTDRAVEETRGI